ncbi:hypothetical protein L0Y59_00970 [Candidatus Uhrbacteria bacterium]|nr:hypothetical protein [Candidatus Uhrbacteria bacterium]
MEKMKTVIIAVVATVVVAGIAFYLIGLRKTSPTPPPVQDTQAQDEEQVAAPLPVPELTKTFAEPGAGYTMGYPEEWTYETKDETFQTVVFSGAPGTEAYRATVNIQNVMNKENGGEFVTAQELMDDLKAQFTSSEDGVIIDEGPLAYSTAAGETLQGVQVAAEYKLQGETYQQWQIVVPHADGKHFCAIAYTAPAGLFRAYQPTAQALIESWSMVEGTEETPEATAEDTPEEEETR